MLLPSGLVPLQVLLIPGLVLRKESVYPDSTILSLLYVEN